MGYGYDGRNRLAVVQQNGATVATYVYNSSGLRVAKVPAATNSPVRYVYGPDGLLAGEYSAAVREYIAIGTLPLGVVDSASGMAAVHFIHADAIGASRVVTDQSGAVLRTRAYASNPFGETSPFPGAPFRSTCAIRGSTATRSRHSPTTVPAFTTRERAATSGVTLRAFRPVRAHSRM